MNCGGNMIRLAVCDDEKIFLDIVSHNLEEVTKNLVSNVRLMRIEAVNYCCTVTPNNRMMFFF